MGATLVSTGDRISNNNYMKVGVLGAYNLPIVEWTRLIDTDTPKPGYILQWKAGAGGEDVVQMLDVKEDVGIAFSEFDPGLVATCNTAYAATDEIPIIPIFLNPGAILRNVHCCDPTANVNAGDSYSSGTTSGLLSLCIEATLASTTGTTYAFSTATLGTAGTGGTFILSRVYAVQMYYLVNPSAAYQDVVSIVWCR